MPARTSRSSRKGTGESSGSGRRSSSRSTSSCPATRRRPRSGSSPAASCRAARSRSRASTSAPSGSASSASCSGWAREWIWSAGEQTTATVTATAGPLRGTVVEAAEIPSLDEVPILAVAAAVATGETTFRDVGELRVKESDRLAGVADLVRAFGADAEVVGDDLVVRGAGRLSAGSVRSLGDHRMAMAAAVASLAAGEGDVDDVDCIATSYPGFVDDLVALGGSVVVPRIWVGTPAPPVRRAVPAGGDHRHRRAGRFRQVDGLADAGETARHTAARHRGDVPGDRLGRARPGDRPGRRRTGRRRRPRRDDRRRPVDDPDRRHRRDRRDPVAGDQSGRLGRRRQPGRPGRRSSSGSADGRSRTAAASSRAATSGRPSSPARC